MRGGVRGAFAEAGMALFKAASSVSRVSEFRGVGRRRGATSTTPVTGTGRFRVAPQAAGRGVGRASDGGAVGPGGGDRVGGQLSGIPGVRGLQGTGLRVCTERWDITLPNFFVQKNFKRSEKSKSTTMITPSRSVSCDNSAISTSSVTVSVPTHVQVCVRT